MSDMRQVLTKGNALTDEDKVHVNHVEFAGAVLASRRVALGLTVEQIRQMASAIMVLDHQRHDMEEKLVTMMAAEPVEVVQPEPVKEAEAIEKTVYVPIIGETADAINLHINKIMTAYQVLEAERFGPEESTAIRNMQKAAEDMGKYTTSQLNKRKSK